MDIKKFLKAQPIENMLNLIKDLESVNYYIHCNLDEINHCITHGWNNSQIECPHKRAKELLIAMCWFCDEEGYLDQDIGNVAKHILCDHEE